MKLLRRLRSLFRREKLEAEMAEEMRHHLELQAERNRAAGMDAREASYAAEREFGNVASLQERARELRGWIWLEQCGQDLRYAARSLARAPGFAVVVIATLGLGIGLNTMVFSFYHMLTGKQLAVRAPEEIVRVTAQAGRFQSPFTDEEYSDLRARLHSVESLVATSPLQVVSTEASGAGSEQTSQAAVQFVSANYFSSLGVRLLIGRGFEPDEPDAAVLSYEGWRERFGADAQVLGKSILIEGVPVPIVGVAPPDFGGTIPPATPDFWLPRELQPRVLPNFHWLHGSSVRIWQLLARRKADTPPTAVGAEVVAIARTWRQPDGKPLEPRVQAATFFQLDTPQVHAVCVTLLLAVGLILLVGCVNVVNLLFARVVAREHELAVRLALGASRNRLLRQLCTEFILLGALGGVLGLAIASGACDALRVEAASLGREITGGTWTPFLDLRPDARVFAYAFGLSLTTGVLVGLKPAWHGARGNAEVDLRRQTTGATSGGSSGRYHRLLAVQVAACLVLLAGAGLLLRGARRALTVDPGYDAKHLLMVIQRSTTSPLQVEGARRIVERLQAVPGVLGVGGTDRAPFAGHTMSAVATDDGRWVNGCILLNIDRGYFETLGLRLVAGRAFTPDEIAQSAPVVIITQSAARHLWPGKDPLGRRIVSPPREYEGAHVVHYTVVGVVQDARFTDLSKTDNVDLFFPQPALAKWVVRTHGRPEAAISSVYAALDNLDPTLRARTAVWTLEDGSMRVQRLFAAAPASFASLLGMIALALAAVGVFGVVSFAVARRMREFGVRVALGAQAADVIRHVLSDTLRPVAWGTAVGLAGAVAISTALARLVLSAEIPDLTYGAGAFPAATFAAASAVLVAVVLFAAWLPARRAAKVDPVIALRSE
ncbi:MAG TPA: ADOP family duplicated permease [Lacunisphaera sp.]|jgi:predicted permease|nr:ADOP family duplicated permease [Lacunisphaera sp.]